MKAILRNYRQSPRKVRLLADLIRGKDVSRAIPVLSAVSKRASLPFKKLVESAVANATNNDKANEDALFIKEVSVNEGPTMKRMRARARGAGHPIRKRTSHISIVLGEREAKKVEKMEVEDKKEEVKKEAKK